MKNNDMIHCFTASKTPQAEEMLNAMTLTLKKQLEPYGNTISVFLGGSYGRGEGGVENTPEGCRLYNDLDFFVFAPEWKLPGARRLQEKLNDIAQQWKTSLNIDVDFSPAKGYLELYRHGKRLIYQELKHGNLCVAGKQDFLKAIPDRQPEELPWTEAGRLLLNRGMGLLLAAEELQKNSPDPGFVARNLNKLILGCADALLISKHLYQWSWTKRQERLAKILTPEDLQRYRTACQFKKHPLSSLPKKPKEAFQDCKTLFMKTVQHLAGNQNVPQGLLDTSRTLNLTSPMHALNFMRKTGQCSMAPNAMLPPVIRLLADLYLTFDSQADTYPRGDDSLHRAWQRFN